MTHPRELRRSLADCPLQASKLIGICLGLLGGVAGFLGVVGPGGVDLSSIAEGAILPLVVVPLVGAALAGVVVLETLHSSYRAFRAETTIRRQVVDRAGYTLLRAIEAAVAVGGLVVVWRLVSKLANGPIPSTAGVDVVSGLLAVGGGILAASLLRSVYELWYFGG
ncbi:hypothetical protein [Halohasta salina]|uniref:hypothetical protein n=1 Tax=Halohasta salina TaxID=2961621 RepID=UPI0020A313A7|nr:hypothetical protein [Halohasta salina]